jgi:hypothetical protein
MPRTAAGSAIERDRDSGRARGTPGPIVSVGPALPRWTGGGSRSTGQDGFAILRSPADLIPSTCGSGGTGRRASLRSLWPQGRGGSSPLFRTNRFSAEPTCLLSRFSRWPLPTCPRADGRRTDRGSLRHLVARPVSDGIALRSDADRPADPRRRCRHSSRGHEHCRRGSRGARHAHRPAPGPPRAVDGLPRTAPVRVRPHRRVYPRRGRQRRVRQSEKAGAMIRQPH